MKGCGLYVHVPFCLRRCPYCAFAAEAGREEAIPAYVEAVVSELLRRGANWTKGPVATVFFGGGTPSLLTPAQVGAILTAARRKPGIDAGAEITLEANPGTVDTARLAGYRCAGVNRLSVGVQSFDDCALRWLGRTHSVADAENAYRAGREAGFDNINLDLMFGIPGMRSSSWESTLTTALSLRPEHVSTYGLTVEEGTDLGASVAAGRVPAPDEQADAAEYDCARQSLAEAGYRHYEVSNFALPGRGCRHNWSCWDGGEYLGVGAAAHSYSGGVRSWNRPGLDEYMAAMRVDGRARAGQERIDRATGRRERIWMQLRTDAGVQLRAHERGYLETSPRFADLQEAGLIGWKDGRLCLGSSGWPVADALGVEIVELLERAQSGSAAACSGAVQSVRVARQ